MFAYTLALSEAQLKRLLVHLESFFGQAILENVTELCFVAINRPPDEFRFNADFILSVWERGRAFGEQIELRWRRRRGQYVVLLITDVPLLLTTDVAVEVGSLPEAKILERIEPEKPLQIILWGEWQDSNAEPDVPRRDRYYWYEDRIPKFLAYPWNEHDKRLAIEVIQYHSPSSSDNAAQDFPADYMFRFVRVVAVTSSFKGVVSDAEILTEKEEEDD